MGKLGKRAVLALLTVTLMVGLVPSTQAWAVKKITVGRISMSGTAAVGGKLTVSVKQGKPKRLTYSYQWYRSGKKIKNAKKSVYRPTRLDWGKKLAVKITAKKKGYKTTSRMVRLVNPIRTGRITRGSVSISGFRCAGNTFGINMTWPNAGPSMGATFSYQWYRNGVAISAPTARTDRYKSTSVDANTYLSVAVTASAIGYYSTTATSPRVRLSTC
ncbi:MAG: hypothetical protein K4304_03635 [Propionicimonas sp.]